MKTALWVIDIRSSEQLAHSRTKLKLYFAPDEQVPSTWDRDHTHLNEFAHACYSNKYNVYHLAWNMEEWTKINFEMTVLAVEVHVAD